MKKYLSAFILIAMAVLTITGCSKPKMEAADSVAAIYDLYVKGESAGVLELGMTKEEVTAALESYDQNLADTLRSNMTSAGLTVEDSVIEEIVEARKTALKAMTVSCELVSSDEETAVVSLKTSYFDETALDEKAADDAIVKAQESGSTNSDELLALATQYYTQNLIDGYLAVTPSEEMKELTVNCVLSKNVWLPEDLASFGEELGKIISGQ